MTLLQLAIGTVNDVVDAPSDAGRKPGKPIPAGMVDAVTARNAAIGLAVAGTLLAASISATLAILSLVVLAIGLWYDLRLKGTAWSWLPFAVGIPILPVYGWLGASGSLVPAFAVLIPAAVAGGAALAISNSLVDVERDLAAGRSSVAADLGPIQAAGIATALVAGVGAAAVVTAWLVGASALELVGLLGSGAIALLSAAVAPGRPVPDREWAWRLEAVALGGMAVLWLGAVLGRN
jgi:4-hydroxybenzoate polyprenyltransferase